jgi:hypothetical protein
MPKSLTNPHSFRKDCESIGVTYDLLIEAQECLGKQACSKLFKGKCMRGGGNVVSSALVEDWIFTLKYSIDNPDEEDKDSYKPRFIEPLKEWYEFVEIVKKPIDKDIYSSWPNFSSKKLGEEVRKYGLIFGTANSNALKTLHERAMTMIERRKNNFWNKEEIQDNKEEEQINYNTLNIIRLREIAKDMGCTVYHQSKEELIDNIKKKQEEISSYVLNEEKIKESYDNMTLLTLKLLAKDKGLTEYNNLKKEDLVKALIDFDKIEEEKDKITLGGVEVISRPSDGYINASQLCNAGHKKYKDWYKLDKTKEFLEELSYELKLDILKNNSEDFGGGGNSPHPITNVSLIEINQHSNSDQSTWVHPRVAIHIAQWISPKFAVNVTGWIHKLLSEGSVKIDRPVKSFSTLTEMDIDAEKLENELNISDYTNDSILYCSYIGNGLIKIGFTDSNLLKRDKKHMSSESLYPQWRMIKLFKVSGRNIEKMVHDFLKQYKADFFNQKEIYRPVRNLEYFIDMISDFLKENDLKMTIKNLEKENYELKLKNAELRLLLSNK